MPEQSERIYLKHDSAGADSVSRRSRRHVSSQNFTTKLSLRPGSRPCKRVHGSRYGRYRTCGDKHGGVRRSCSDCILLWRTSAASAVLRSLISLPFISPSFSYFAKGAPISVSSSLASASVLAVVTKQMSIPRILSTLSYSISGNISCSFRPRE